MDKDLQQSFRDIGVQIDLPDIYSFETPIEIGLWVLFVFDISAS
jgi:hypothetical protein